MNRFALRTAAAAVSAAALLTALPAAAQFQKAEDAIKYRKAAFTVLAAHFGRVSAMAQGKAPFDPASAAANAELAATLGKLPWAAFGPDTQTGGDTKAKPAIWTEMDKFRDGAKKMQDELDKLNAAAKTGSLDQIKAAAGAAGKTCKACHDDYKAK